ncbi:MAG: hypothetical protein JWP00_1320 [Chloroflexi bacterium]|nr:hypothetical protein [Chloroflexota bacterium]
MRLDSSAWSNTGDSAGWQCPGCGANLPDAAFAAGQRLARCRRCSKMVHRETPQPQGWPVGPDRPLQESRSFPASPSQPDRLEVAPSYAFPALACPYCEHLNQDGRSVRPDGQQFCANCGADLKKACLTCDEPMYVLDHYCTRCRSDQEKAKYEIEGVYWQHFNEGKRLVQLGRWEDAERELGLFFNPAPGLDREHVRLAHQIYVSSIAPFDGGEGLELYNEAVEQVRLSREAYRQKLQRRKYQKWVGLAVAALLLGILSAVTLGSWWAIFIIVPLASFIIILVGWLILVNLGLA